MTLLKLCLSITGFQFQGKLHELEDGLPIRSPVSPVGDNIFMADLEMNALVAFGCAHSVWYRYIDYVLSAVKPSLIKSLLNH